MDRRVDQWTEEVNAADVKTLFGSFDVDVPDDASNLSFAKGLLEASKLKEFKREMNSLASEVVLFRNLSQKDNIPGTVYVFEVDLVMKLNKNNEVKVTIKEKDPKDPKKRHIFFTGRKKDIVKIILIHSKSLNVIEAKEKVYKKYKDVFHSEKCYVQHVCEEYGEVSKLSGHRKITKYTQLVQSLIEMIPLDDIEDIINRAANRSLSKESITELCFSAVIQESGNTDSDPYYCRSFFTVRRLKRELVENTMESMRQSLVSEVRSEIHQHIAKNVKGKVGPIQFFISLAFPTILNSMILGVAIIVALWVSSIAALIVSAFVIGASFLFAVDVNSTSWRRKVADEIHENLSKNKEKVLKDISSNIKRRCKETIDQLKTFTRHLEDFQRRINLIDQDTEASEWEKRHVIKDNSTLRKNSSIVTFIADKSIIPFGEKPIPNRINGCNCDIRENIILFGSCDDCGEENANPGCSVGMTFSSIFGSAGFLANSTRTDETGFLTAAHVAVRKLEKLYLANALLSICNDGDESNVIVHPSVYHANLHGLQSRRIGEVRESYFGNYQSAGMDAAFVGNYKPTIRGQTPLQIADENDFKNFHGTLVRKKGKVTGETVGILVSGMISIRVDNVPSPLKYRFDYCYEIINKHGYKPFFEPGDSGSGVYLLDERGNKKPVGIAFAFGLNGDTYACRIEYVTRAFELSLYDVQEPIIDELSSLLESLTIK
uniref:Peptidase S1 domain-containing protein n=1 Tax=Magallana gigas TaxID=29159 RepID=A0A8W8NZR8_MAGGI